MKLTRRRMLGGIITVSGAGAAAGAGTMAYFSDSEASGKNSIQTGTLELTFTDGASFDFNTALAPTQSSQDTVTLVNAGTVTGSVDVDVHYTENDASDDLSTDMDAQNVAENIEITTLSYGGDDISDQIDTTNDPPTLHDLANNQHGENESTQDDLINLADPGDGTDFTVEFRLKDVSDDYQGDGVDVTFTFHLNQTDGQ